MKNKCFSIVCTFLVVFLFVFSGFSLGFTDEETEKINTNVSKMVEGSKNIGCKYSLAEGSTNSIYFTSNTAINGVNCYYVALMYWNNQFKITLTDNVLTAKCVWSGTHELVAFLYNNTFECVGYYIYNISINDSTSIGNVDGYFKSSFNVVDSSGEHVEPFFYFPPQTTLGLVEILTAEKTEAKTLQEVLGVLPLIIVVVVSFLGLRKALRMLLAFLNRS